VSREGEYAMQIVVLDVETTGKERATDQIVELCLRFGLGPDAESRTWRIRPEVAIHPEATGVHGITMEMLVDCPLFAVAVSEFLPLLAAADVIVGYNVSFDLDMIQSEIARAGMPPFSLTGKQIVDALRLWHHVEPRTLAAAHVKFCGEPLINAHQAEADVAATARVLTAMLVSFGLDDRSWPELAAIADPFAKRASWLGPSPHIQWDESGAVVFGFGKYKGQLVSHADGGFLRWVLAKDFPPHVHKICRVARERRGQFDSWIATYYPRPTAKAQDEDDPFADDLHPFVPEGASAQGVLL
jgi:DNA polymerase III epsilon subunit-like protein